MGGQIAVSSAADEGSVFTVILPVILAKAPTQAQAHAQETIPGSMPARKILLADDDQRGRAVAQKLLERSGYTVTAVENGSELLDALQNGDFDIVLTDISMPDMEGTQVAKIIRSGERAGIDPCVPIIAMTAHALTEDRDRFLASGIDGFVAKPFNFAELLRQIEELCSRRVG
jgi:CheY-like chemotaxis protein